MYRLSYGNVRTAKSLRWVLGSPHNPSGQNYFACANTQVKFGCLCVACRFMACIYICALCFVSVDVLECHCLERFNTEYIYIWQCSTVGESLLWNNAANAIKSNHINSWPSLILLSTLSIVWHWHRRRWQRAFAVSNMHNVPICLTTSTSTGRKVYNAFRELWFCGLLYYYKCNGNLWDEFQ